MTPLERYEAYKKSQGLSETPATVTRPQSYNIRTGGVSQEEQTNIQSIRDRQAADKEANKKQQEKFWAITMSKGTDVPKIILSQPDTPNTIKGNLQQYLDKQNIDVDNVPIDWMQPIKQTELRQTLAEREIFLKTGYASFQPTARKNAYSFGANTQTIDLPLAAESPIKQNDFLPPSETSKQILEIPPVNTGRIELNANKNKEPCTDCGKKEKSDNTKYFAIGGIAIAALVLFLILRRRK
tara:strand:- start:514 stop:1233 length:720 start_codon:yes stop_codon:yes gene_type:complete